MIFVISALFFIRLFFWRIFPQYETGFLSDVVFGMYCLTALALYSLTKTRSLLAPWIGLWVLAAMMSFFTSNNPTLTVAYWFALLTYTLLFCCGCVSMKKADEAPGFLWGVMYVGACLCAAIGIWEFYILHTSQYLLGANQALNIAYGMKRACSLQGWPTAFAGFLILFLPWAWLHFQEQRTFWRTSALILMVFGLLSSVSALPILSLGIAIFLTAQKGDYKWWPPALGALFFFVCGTKILDAFLLSRGEYYSAAWTMITQHPFLGGGLGAFRSYGISKSAFVHNSYVQMWAECGPLGLIAVLGLASTFWKMKPAKDNLLQKAIYTGLLAVFIDNLFSFTILKPNLSLVWWLGLAIYSNLWSDTTNGPDLRH